jgi:hypothetical protein
VRRKGGNLQGMGLAWVAQLVERVLGKDEVTGSIPVPGSRIWMVAGGEEIWGAAVGAKENLGELGRG